MSDFVLIGAAGYIASRHMKAIKETGHRLVAALDPNDSVGIIDSYFPEADFFVEFERFDRHIDLLRRRGEPVDYVSICSPNYLHDAHIRFALRSGAHAICEKPLVLNPWNVDALAELEAENGHHVYCVLQLRLHPSLIELKRAIDAAGDRRHEVDITYITSRGHWYNRSWKGDEEKSGGIATNIGVHFFDMLAWIFGPVEENRVHVRRADCAAGALRLARANVRWFLSVNSEHLPDGAKARGQRTYRSITVDEREVEFSDGFTDLHTDSYRHILAGQGFGLADAKTAVSIVQVIRTAELSSMPGSIHPPLLRKAG